MQMIFFFYWSSSHRALWSEHSVLGGKKWFQMQYRYSTIMLDNSYFKCLFINFSENFFQDCFLSAIVFCHSVLEYGDIIYRYSSTPYFCSQPTLSWSCKINLKSQTLHSPLSSLLLGWMVTCLYSSFHSLACFHLKVILPTVTCHQQTNYQLKPSISDRFLLSVTRDKTKLGKAALGKAIFILSEFLLK